MSDTTSDTDREAGSPSSGLVETLSVQISCNDATDYITEQFGL